MVSDGMSAGTFWLAHRMRLERDQRPSAWSRLWNMPGVRRSLNATHAADSLVTDSAAASSAWSIGVKVNNDAINFTPDGRTPTPILIHARQNGKATGLVTTTRVTHATPAGFAAHAPKRSFEDAIAAQFVARGIDVILGGGSKHFKGETLANAGAYTRVSTAPELAAARSSGPVLGLFASSHIPYALDRGPEVPSLAAMSRAALDRLASAPNGFVLQIEGGRVDHAAHDNDAAGLVFDQLDFDDAVDAVLQWIEGRDDTLLIITTDHGNANPGLTMYGKAGNEGFARLRNATRSFEWIGEQLTARGAKGPDEIAAILPELVSTAAGAEFTAKDLDPVIRVLRGERVHPFRTMNKPWNVLGCVLANHYAVGFVSPNHTGDFAELTLLGPGAETIAPISDNTDLHGLMVRTLALAPAAEVEVGHVTGPEPEPE